MIKKTICAVLVAGVLITGTGILPAQNIYAKEENGQADYQYEAVADNTFEIGQVGNFSGVSTYAATSSVSGTWIKASNGKWWYKHADGSYTKNDWEKIDGKWYYFDADGWMRTGWLRVNYKWYYLNPTGDMRTGWLNYKEKWYYFLSNGVMNTGWLNRNYIWYYFDDTTGAMVTGWRKINGYWYYFLENGYMNTANLLQDNRFYTFYDTGRILFSQIILTEQKQQKSNWCWAASSAMVGTYKTNSTKTQSDIVKKIKGQIIDEGGDAFEIADAVNYASDNTKVADVYFPFGFNDVTSEIDKNHPFIICINWYNQSYGHAVVGTGYDVEEKRILVVDPGVGVDMTTYDYKTLVNGGDFLTGSGYWALTVSY